MNKDFDSAAATWDQDAGRVKLAGDIAAAILNTAKLTPDMDVLDYGCGTGLLTLALQPHVGTVTGMDSSQGMLDVLDAKIRERGLTNVRSQYLDLEKAFIITERFHLITCGMTLHHVQDPAILLAALYNSFHSQGHLCIADLDPDEGKFHGTSEGVFHPGFTRSRMRQYFIQAGFSNITDTTAATILKETADGNSLSFSVFLMTGQRP